LFQNYTCSTQCSSLAITRYYGGNFSAVIFIEIFKSSDLQKVLINSSVSMWVELRQNKKYRYLIIKDFSVVISHCMRFLANSEMYPKSFV
jgi:hypothetical protein